MKLHWKLAAGVGAVVLLTTSATGVAVSRWAQSAIVDATRRSLSDQARLLGEAIQSDLARGAEPELGRRVERLGRALGSRFTIVAASGRVLADSERDPATLANHANRPELLAAATSGFGTSARFSHTLKIRMLYVAVRAPGEPPAALVRAALPLAEVDDRVSRVRDAVVLAALIGLAVAMLPSLYVARRISAPIARLTEGARALAAGDYAPRPRAAARGDELGELVDVFDAMAAQMRERVETITTDRNKLRAILGSMIEGVVAIDPDHRILHLNGMGARILGADPEGALGRRILDVTRVAEIPAALAGVLEDPGRRALEVRLPASPRDVVLDVRVAPLRGRDGTVAGALGVLHDVTELRRLEQVRRDFVGNVSHELKTPLTAIRGQLETLLDDAEMPVDVRTRFLERANAQALRLSNLVRDLLVLSRVESIDTGLVLEEHDLAGPVGESARALQGAADGKGVALETRLPSEPLVARADREHVRQVVDNLLGNALNYTPAGGRVRLELREQDGGALIEVTDTGIGIAPGDQARIFERFYRVDKGRSRELGGTGLGLAIVKHVAAAHGGRASVESAVGSGSTFRVWLPCRGPQGAGARRPERAHFDAT